MGFRSRFLLLFLIGCMPCPGLVEDLPTAEEIRSSIDEAFNRPEFKPAVKSWLGQLWEKVREMVVDAFVWLLRNLGEGLSTPGVSTVVIILLSAFLLFLLARMVFIVLAREKPGGHNRPVVQTPRAFALAPEPHLALAREHASQGRFHEAMRSLYLAVVLWLDGAHHVRYEESKTGGEYLREISAAPVSSPFGSLLRVFYPVAFGGRPVACDVYEKMRAHARKMGVPA